jgi:hypothetical protein
LAEPAKRFVQIGATPHHGYAGSGFGLEVALVADAKILQRTRMRDTCCKPQNQQGNS